MKKVVAVIFHAPCGGSPLERLTEAGQRANAVDLVQWLASAKISSVDYVTSSHVIASQGVPPGVTPVPSGDEARFHFGDYLHQLIRGHRPDGLLYFGSGSGALLDNREIDRLVEFAGGAMRGALFNNFYSCDFAAIANPQELLSISLPPIDNSLGFALADAGFPCYALPRDRGTQCDIDTPIDLLLLHRTGCGGRALLSYLQTAIPPHPTLDAVLPLLTDRSAVLALVGRINPTVWSHFESEVACRTNGYVEGRGMRSAGTPHMPFLAQVLREDGGRAFFRRLARAADGAVIDSRVLLADRGVLPEKADRFASDWFQTGDIADPLWHAFTEEAAAAPLPVLLGGHSLVSGGLYLLADACWKGSELPRRLHPDPYPWEDAQP